MGERSDAVAETEEIITRLRGDLSWSYGYGDVLRDARRLADLVTLEMHLAEVCPECGTPGPQRHLSAVGGCGTCMASDPRPVAVPLRNPHAGVLIYDMVLPGLPDKPAEWWKPFRVRIPRVSRWRAGRWCI